MPGRSNLYASLAAAPWPEGTFDQRLRVLVDRLWDGLHPLGVSWLGFYLDRPGMGLLYAAFCWTGIPSLIGIFEAVKYIRMDEEEFQRRSFAKDL